MAPVVIAIIITIVTFTIIIVMWVVTFKTFKRASRIMLAVWLVVLSAVAGGIGYRAQTELSSVRRG